MFLNAAVLLNFLLQIFFKYAFIYMTFSGKKKSGYSTEHENLF